MKLFALCANSVKNHLMARDIVPVGQQCLPVQLRIVGKVQVVNRSALVTAEMRVGHCLCVIALHRKCHPADCTFICQKV